MPPHEPAVACGPTPPRPTSTAQKEEELLRSLQGKSPQVHPEAFISEAAYVVGDVEIAARVNIWPGVVIRGDRTSAHCWLTLVCAKASRSRSRQSSTRSGATMRPRVPCDLFGRMFRTYAVYWVRR